MRSVYSNILLVSGDMVSKVNAPKTMPLLTNKKDMQICMGVELMKFPHETRKTAIRLRQDEFLSSSDTAFSSSDVTASSAVETDGSSDPLDPLSPPPLTFFPFSQILCKGRLEIEFQLSCSVLNSILLFPFIAIII